MLKNSLTDGCFKGILYGVFGLKVYIGGENSLLFFKLRTM